MCRIDLCGQIGVKISSYGDTQFMKFNPLIRPWGPGAELSHERICTCIEEPENMLNNYNSCIHCILIDR